MLQAAARRSLAACSRSALGLAWAASGTAAAPALPASAAVAAASAAAAARLWPRAYSQGPADTSSGEGEGSEAPAATAAGGGECDAEPGSGEAVAGAAGEAEGESGTATEAAGGEAEDAGGEEQADSLSELYGGKEPLTTPLEMFSKRQRAHLGEDPERYKHFKPSLNRRETGSFADPMVAEEFEIERHFFAQYPPDKPLYNLRTSVPEIDMPQSELMEKIMRMKAEHPDMDIDDFITQVLGIDLQEDQPPHPGAKPILRWEVHLVMAVGVDEPHPKNKKAKLQVFLRELQQEAGLSDAALQHIARVAGPRYNPNKGELTLTSARYPHREANREHIMEMLYALVDEGHARHPNPQAQQQQQVEASGGGGQQQH